MSQQVDTDSIIQAIRKENEIYKQKIDELISKIIRIEQSIVEISRVVYPIPQMDLTKLNSAK